MTRPSLADIEQRTAAATEGPWEVNGPDEDWAVIHSGPDSVIHAYTVHDPDCEGCTCGGDEAGHVAISVEDAELIAHARMDLVDLTAAVRDVLALHAPAPVYAHIDDCGHPDDGDHGIEGDRRDEYFCPDTPTGDVLCEGCGLDEDQEPTSYPCPTIRALATRLDLTDPEGDPT